MPNSPLSRFQKEQILRGAGIHVPAYPVGSGDTSPDADARLLAQGNAWESDLDRQYVEYLQRQARNVGSVMDYADMCARAGVAAALVELNRRVPHRYTAAYRLDGGTLLRNVELIDKENEVRPEYLAQVPLETSFCQFVLRQGRFLTSDSSKDDRLDGHPYKGVMMAYHGVPIIDDHGALLGTLCHFDVQAQPFTDEEFAHIEAVAKIIHPFLPR